MTKRLEKMFTVCTKLEDVLNDLVELGLYERAKQLRRGINEYYNECLEVENEEEQMKADYVIPLQE